MLVEFWATWCGPCRQSIPHLNALHAKFKDRLVVIGLSDETPGRHAQNGVAASGLLRGHDRRHGLGRRWKQGIPHAMLMDPDGIVRFEVAGASESGTRTIVGQVFQVTG